MITGQDHGASGWVAESSICCLFSCNHDVVSGKILIAPATCMAFSLQFSLAHDHAIFHNKQFTYVFLDHPLLIIYLITVFCQYVLWTVTVFPCHKCTQSSTAWTTGTAHYIFVVNMKTSCCRHVTIKHGVCPFLLPKGSCCQVTHVNMHMHTFTSIIIHCADKMCIKKDSKHSIIRW